MKTTAGTRFRVGLFVLASLLIGGAIAFIVGSQKNVFSSKTTYQARFDDVGGLRPGSPVRVAGVNVGTVTDVTFDDQGGIAIFMRIVNDATHLIRGDVTVTGPTAANASRIAIGSKGLLGDRLIEITVGDPKMPKWDPKVPIPEAGGSGLMARAEDALKEVEGTAENLRLATDPFRDQQFSNDLKDTARNLAKVTGMLADQDGAIQRLMNDAKVGRDMAAAMNNFKEAAGQVSELSRSLKKVTKEIEGGDGTAHALIYGQEGADAIKNIRDATGHLAVLLKDIREGDGMAHDLVYGDVGNDFFDNLNKASADLAHMTAEMRAGRGTVGALMTDPSLYEDMKRLIGDLERNDILRALVRYSIRRDEARERIDVDTAEK